MIIALTEWEYRRGWEVGIARYTANWGRSNAAHYEDGLLEPDRVANPAAALCEIAVAKYLGRFWHGHVWHKSDHAANRSLPDVGDNIEVRRVRSGCGPCVRTSDRGRIVWGAREADDEFRTIELLGWVLADDAFTSVLWRRAGEYGHFPSNLLKKPWLP